MTNDTVVEPETADTDVRVPLFPIGMVGAATLLFEILLTRIFSVTMWYHFAFVAISLALFLTLNAYNFIAAAIALAVGAVIYGLSYQGGGAELAVHQGLLVH